MPVADMEVRVAIVHFDRRGVRAGLGGVDQNLQHLGHGTAGYEISCLVSSRRCWWTMGLPGLTKQELSTRADT